ncbi:unnamed protein product [Symbiodinium sp. CCMP2592]|nr:unnamed protein product [Symbiodinium sp. CCMP2592]
MTAGPTPRSPWKILATRPKRSAPQGLNWQRMKTAARNQSGPVPILLPDPHAAIGYALEIEMEKKDWKALIAKPKKSHIWLSKRMQEKGKEHNWSLTASELAGIKPERVMQMRWVLTTKSSGLAKARLVILGYQSPTLLTPQSSSPTLSRLGKFLLLTTVANCQWILESADVTSAFLQAMSNLEADDLYVYAPSELGAAFGGSGQDDRTILKVLRAFYGLVDSPRRWHETVTKVLEQQGWKPLSADRCVYVLFDKKTGELCGIAGVHVDDFLVAGNRNSATYAKAREDLENAFTWGRWEQGKFEFAGCDLEQKSDGSITLGQETYTQKWIEEAPLTEERARQKNSPLTAREIGHLRGVLGTLAWRSTQTSPQFSAEAGLLLSEVGQATVDTLVRANRLVGEARRTAEQTLVFHAFGRPWKDLVAIVWADAAQNNRPKKGSTVGIVGALAPREILQGEKTPLNVVSWRSTKAPRESLGSNGSEVQAITVGEDLVYLIRAMWMEFNGVAPQRGKLNQLIREHTTGALVMDSRGIFDAMTRNTSALHGLRSSRAGYELTTSVSQAVEAGTILRWVAGTEMIADALTKASARKVFLQLLSQRQEWRLVYDPDFTAGRKLNKREHEKRVQELSANFLAALQQFAEEQRLPWGTAEAKPEEEDLMSQSECIMSAPDRRARACVPPSQSGSALLWGGLRSSNWQLTHEATDAAEEAEAVIQTLLGHGEKANREPNEGENRNDELYVAKGEAQQLTAAALGELDAWTRSYWGSDVELVSDDGETTGGKPVSAVNFSCLLRGGICTFTWQDLLGWKGHQHSQLSSPDHRVVVAPDHHTRLDIDMGEAGFGMFGDDARPGIMVVSRCGVVHSFIDVLSMGISEYCFSLLRGRIAVHEKRCLKYFIMDRSAGRGAVVTVARDTVLWRHLEDTGEDLTAMYQEMKDKKEQEQAQRRREESEKKKEMKKQQREQHIENFRAVYGALTGSLVMALPGWSGEAKLQENCGQLCSSYYDPEGRSWKLLKDIEAHFGSLMEQGKQDTFPDFDAARDSQATDENGKVINIARQQNQVEAWTREQKPPESKEKPRKRKRELKMVDYGHYRETSHLKLFDVSEMTEKAMERERLPDGPALQKEAQRLLQLLIQRGLPETTQILYMRGSGKKAAGSKLIRAMSGWYFRRPFEVADRSCYQHVRLIGGKPVCSEAHVFWSAHYSLWKLGALTDDKASGLGSVVRVIRSRVQTLENGQKRAEADGALEALRRQGLVGRVRAFPSACVDLPWVDSAYGTGELSAVGMELGGRPRPGSIWAVLSLPRGQGLFWAQGFQQITEVKGPSKWQAREEAEQLSASRAQHVQEYALENGPINGRIIATSFEAKGTAANGSLLTQISGDSMFLGNYAQDLLLCRGYLLLLALPVVWAAITERRRQQDDVDQGDAEDEVSQDGNDVESAAEFLSGGPDVRVLFSIQTAAHNVAAIRAAAETWASAVPPGQLQVIGMSEPKHWEMKGMLWDKSDCPDTHSGGACKDFTALSNAWQSGFDWVVLLGTDNYAVAKNIKAALASRSPSTAEVLGIRGCGKCKAGGLCGGGGQIFSRGALEKMVGQGKESYMRESMKEASACGMWGDVSNCRVAAAHHVPVHDLPGLHGWRLDDEELQQALLSPYPPPLTFHYLQIDEIRALHAMVASNHESFFESVTGLQAQGLSRWYARRDRYVAAPWPSNGCKAFL